MQAGPKGMIPRLFALFLLALATLPAQRVTLYLKGGEVVRLGVEGLGEHLHKVRRA